MTASQPGASNIAVYIDLENVAIGVREAKLRTFQIGLKGLGYNLFD